MPSGARCHPPAEWSGGFRPAWPPRSGPGCSPPSRCCLQSSPQPGPLEWPSHTESLPQSWSGLGREGCQWLETPGVGQGGGVDPRAPQRSTLTLTPLPSPLTGPAPTGGIPKAPTLLTQASFPPGGEWKGGVPGGSGEGSHFLPGCSDGLSWESRSGRVEASGNMFGHSTRVLELARNYSTECPEDILCGYVPPALLF